MPPTDPPALDTVSVRPAGPDDLPVVAELNLAARAAAHPAMPAGVHTDDEVREWVRGWDLERHEPWLALAGDRPVGYARLSAGWLDDLYVDPAAQRLGVGSMLLDLAKARRPDGFCLWVFASNTPARRLYAGRGLVELEHTDGAGNEEHAPDLKMAWPGRDPVAFYRRLIDEVDTELGDVLARRAALTQAVQPHKSQADRDAAREREVVETLARRAPALGPDRLARVVDVVIAESLDAARPPDAADASAWSSA